MLIVFTTTPNETDAEALAEKIVEARLAACVQILPPMTSIYAWEGEMQRDPEHLLLIKTLAEKFDELEAFIRENHSYSVPEIVAVSSERVSDAYQSWMQSVLDVN